MTVSSPRHTRFRYTAVHVVGLFAIALALRLAVWNQVRHDPTFQVPVGDMKGNHEFAVQVLEGTLPPLSFYKAPLYGYFLAGIYAVAGVDVDVARYVQIALTSLIPVVTYLLGRRFFGVYVGLIAGLIAALYWTFIFFSIELLDTGPASLLYLLVAYALVRLDDRRWTSWLAIGALLGLAGITRPNILAFAPVLALTAFVALLRRHTASDEPATGSFESARLGSRLRLAVLCVVALTVGCSAVVLPVTLRNRIVGGEWVLIGAYGGLNLYVANSPYSDSKDGPLLVPPEYLTAPNPIDHNSPEPWARNCLNYNVALRVGESVLGRRPTPGEFSSILAGMAVDYLRDHPRWFLEHAFMRLCWLFNAYEFQSNRDLYSFLHLWGPLRYLSYLHYGIVCPLAVIGLAFALASPTLRTRAMAYYVAMIVALALPAVAFIINCRFRTPLVHLLIPFAAYGLVQTLLCFVRPARWSTRSGVVVALAGLAVFSNANLFDYRSHNVAHFKAQYLGACERAGRDDLLPEAYDALATALDREMADLQPGNTSLMLEYGPYMTRLFIHYMQRGNISRALDYGDKMIARERIVPDIYLAYFDRLLRLDELARAAEALTILERRCLPKHRSLLARLYLRCGVHFKHRPSLVRSIHLLRKEITINPADATLRALLETAKGALADVTTQTSTRPSPSNRPAETESTP